MGQGGRGIDKGADAPFFYAKKRPDQWPGLRQ